MSQSDLHQDFSPIRNFVVQIAVNCGQFSPFGNPNASFFKGIVIVFKIKNKRPRQLHFLLPDKVLNKKFRLGFHTVYQVTLIIVWSVEATIVKV
ncbi:MAG: hypothetical protein LBJ22_05515 [Synergistaceae bacterium]|nr:hypothetical protein [Synergistaceae bacterium]